MRRLYILLFIIFFGIYPLNIQGDETALNEEEVVNLVKPSVVKIIQHVEGTAVIPSFKINENLSVSVDDELESTTIPFNEYLVGSGSIINPDGYILTNSHVISHQTIKLALIEEMASYMLTNAILSMSDEEYEKLSGNDGLYYNIILPAYEYMINNSQFDIQNKIIVLNPSSEGENFDKLIEKGFPAEVVSVHNEYFKNEKDAGIIKINQDNLPAIKLGNSDRTSIGEKVYIFGYPYTAQLDENDVLESTFTTGSLSSIKNLQVGGFNIFQTDAKISQGSSGGPMLNEKGEVVGVVTFQTGYEEQQTGDNFAFTIPVNAAMKIAEEGAEESISFKEGEYGLHFRKGLKLLHNRNCKDALKEFELAKNSNSNFNTDSYISPYIERCNEIISKGESIDNWWDILKAKISQTSRLVWLMGGTIVFILSTLTLVVIWLVVRLREEEEDLDELEDIVQKNKEDLSRITASKSSDDYGDSRGDDSSSQQ